MPPTRELSVETMKRIMKPLQEGNSAQSEAKHVYGSQPAVSNIWSKYKQNGKVVQGKNTRGPEEDVKMSGHNEIKEKQIGRKRSQ